MGRISFFLRSILFAAQSMRLFRAVAIFMLLGHSKQPICFTAISHLWWTILMIDLGRIQFSGRSLFAWVSICFDQTAPFQSNTLQNARIFNCCAQSSTSIAINHSDLHPFFYPHHHVHMETKSTATEKKKQKYSDKRNECKLKVNLIKWANKFRK